jgi:hypothetical protein
MSADQGEFLKIIANGIGNRLIVIDRREGKGGV